MLSDIAPSPPPEAAGGQAGQSRPGDDVHPYTSPNLRPRLQSPPELPPLASSVHPPATTPEPAQPPALPVAETTIGRDSPVKPRLASEPLPVGLPLPSLSDAPASAELAGASRLLPPNIQPPSAQAAASKLPVAPARPVHVHIGAIELRLAPPPPATTAPPLSTTPRQPAKRGFDDYGAMRGYYWGEE